MAAITVPTPGLPCYAAPARSAAVYRRRRIMALLATTAIVLLVALVAVRAAAAFGADPASPPERRPAEVPAHTHVVQPGDTLWSIARRLQPDGDVRRLVHQLATRNGGAELFVGQVLSLPAGA